MDTHSFNGRRRTLVQLAAGGALAATTTWLSPLARAAGSRTLKIGFVSPQTGPLAPFGEADRFMVQQMQAALKDGITIRGKSFPVSIVVRTASPIPTAPAKWPAT
jgi:branched-chain amino acid transport system substrate-binding protein